MKGSFARNSYRLRSVCIALTVGLLGLSLCACLCSCSGTATTTSPTLAQNAIASQYQDSGIIVLSRRLPVVSTPNERFSLLGFLPNSQRGNWLDIDRGSKSVKLMSGDSLILQATGAEGIASLPVGNFSIQHKQRAALWYAPDSYFSSRGLQTPTEGSRDRLLRGALGEFVLFIDESHPLHEGPIWSAEIGGVRLDESDISRMYYQLDLGALVSIH